MNNLVITISREFGSGGHKIGTMLSEKLGIPYYDKDLIKLASEKSGINENLFGLADERAKSSLFKKPKVYSGDITSPKSPEFTSEENLFNYQATVIKELAEKNSPCIIIGRCADFVLSGRENTLRLFIWADKENCIKNTMEILGYDRKEAEKQIESYVNEKLNQDITLVVMERKQNPTRRRWVLPGITGMRWRKPFRERSLRETS